jgi:hypothetical protein
MQAPQTGGKQIHSPVLNEIQVMMGYFILLFLVLTCVYVSRVPRSVLKIIRKSWIQILCFFAIIVITIQYGYVHGILTGLAFALVLSHALRDMEGFIDYNAPAIYISDEDTTTIIPKKHKWFGESILGETPYLIREKGVTTNAVQDLSERTMGTGASNYSK